MHPRVKRLRPRDYTIGWICAIAVEREAAVAVLDETHLPPSSVAHNDQNTYTLGSIGPHNVVICCLPPGIYALTSATTVANHMISTFAEIKATIMVGVGGGAPSRTMDIRLGDVVVSRPIASSPAVMQFDHGKTTPEGFVRTGSLDKPARMLLTAVGNLQGQHKQHGSRVAQILREMQAQQPGKWMPPTADDLFDSTYEHEEGEETCANCDRTKLVPRSLRNGTMPVIHYGLIASANQVMKHGRTRDELQKKYGMLCFEMEAAGLMDILQCLVIRGICDYSDSHKNKAWQSFAAAAAAAYAKELLGVVHPRHRIDSPPPTLGIDFDSRHNRERYKWQKGTCGWVLKRLEFLRWREESQRTCSVLWIFGRIGCGKTKVMSQIIDALQPLHDICLLYFYVDRTTARMSDPKVILLTLRDQILQSYTADEEKIISDISEDTPLIDIEWKLSSFLGGLPGPVYVVIDGLNELEDGHRTEVLCFLASIIELRASRQTGILISSSSHDGRADLGLPRERVPALEITAQDTSDDIRGYVISRMGGLLPSLTTAESADIADRITDRADGMFLWAALQLPIICKHRTVRDALNAIDQLPLPEKIHDSYWQAYGQFNHLHPKDKVIAQTVIALLAHADGPLLAEAVWEALAVVRDDSRHTDDGTKDPDPGLDQFRKDPGLIIGLCGHLVKTDGDPLALRFGHSTIYDFFKEAGSGRLSRDHHSLLSHLYLSYLASTRFDHGPFKDVSWAHPGPIEDCIRDYPLLKSSSCRWAYHTRQALEEGGNSPGITEKLLTFCEKVENMRLAFQVFLFTQRMKLPADLCYSHIISYFGLSQLLDVLKRNGDLDVAVHDSSRLTPLHWAVRGQHGAAAAGTTAKLLQYGADINAEDSNSWTPLHHGAKCGNLAAVQVLLEDDRLKKDFHRNKSGTALIIAALKGYHEIVEKLVEAGADVTANSKYGTAFQAAASSGNDKCLNILLNQRRERGSKFITSSPHKHFGDALQFAAYNCQPKMVELLLKNRARVDGVSSQFGTAMQAAVLGYEDGNNTAAFRKIFDILLRHGADVNKYGGLLGLGPALHIAAGRGFTSLAELLIAKGAEVNLSGPQGTPLQAASDMGNQEMMAVLRQYGATALPAAPTLPGNIYTQMSNPVGDNNTDDIRRFLLWKGIFALPLRLFKLAVAANNSPRIDFLLSNFRGVMMTAINIQSVSMVETFAAQGENVFKAVISLASGKDSSQEQQGVTNRGFIHRVIKKMTQAAVAIFQHAIRGLKRQQVPINDRGPPIRMDSTLSDLGDANDDHFTVIDKLTQVAVNILGHAIKKQKSQEIVGVLSDAWVSALYGVVSESGLGIPVLERLIQVRAQELKSIFTRPDASQKEKMADAEELAQVGVELLATALSRGPKYKPMAASLARLWIVALDDLRRIDDETGGGNFMVLVTLFTTEFEDGLNKDDLQKIKRWAEVGVEVLKEAVVDGNKYLVRLLADKWSALLQKAVCRSDATKKLVNEIMAGRVDEFGGYVRDGCVAAANGLAGAGVAILRAALTHGDEAVEQLLAYNIVSVLQMALESGRGDMVEGIIEQYREDFSAAALDAYKQSQPDQQDTGHLFNTATSLIVTAKERRYTKLLTMLARGSLDVVEDIVSSDYSDFLQDDITRRIRQYYDDDSVRVKRTQTQSLERIFTAVAYLLEIALMERRNEGTFGALIETCSALFNELDSDGKDSLQNNVVVILVKDYKGRVGVEEWLV